MDKIILRGVVGSTAYGLATPDSDIDRLGVYVAPAESFWGFNPPVGKNASKVTTNPDMTYHEIGKFMSLCLKANPTVTELLWLPDHLYEIRDFPSTNPLIIFRRNFLSACAVRNAYLGYATQQFMRLTNRGDGSFSSDTRKRTAKHARHLWRLVHQGVMLHKYGEFNIALTEPDVFICREFGENVAEGDTRLAQRHLNWGEKRFAEPGVLPDEPDTKWAQETLLSIRRSAYHGSYDNLEDLPA